MNRQQFDESMRRVLAFTQAPKTPAEVQHLQSYMNGLYEAISDMDGFLFDQVTVELCRNMSRGQRPMPGQFRAIYYRLKDEHRSKQPERVCPSCKNTTWIEVTLMETATGKEDVFAKPCPECQHGHALKDAPLRSGWVEVERPAMPHDRRLLLEAQKMGLRGARFVLDLVEKHRVNFPDDVLLALLERAGDEPKQENKAAEVVLEKLTVVKEPAREQTAAKEVRATGVAVEGSAAPHTVTVNGEEYEVEE